MPALDLFDDTEIQLRGTVADFKRPARRYREFAVVSGPFNGALVTTIVHVPSGNSLGFAFNTHEAAAEAAVGIDKLRNRWVAVSREEWLELYPDIERICVAAGGWSMLRTRHVGVVQTSGEKAETYNGYKPEEDS